MADTTLQEEVRAILNESRMKRYYGDIFKLTKRKDLLTGDPLSIAVEFIVSVVTNRWPKKCMQQYLLRLLAINNVMNEVLKWRDSNNNNNILHCACQFGRFQVIEAIFSHCGEDFLNELNVDREPPMFYLKFNKANSISRSMNKLLKLFLGKTNDGEAVLKRCLVDLESCSLSFISACLELYEDIEDVSKIDSTIMTALLKYYLRDLSIWNRHPELKSRKIKLVQLVPKLTLPKEAWLDLAKIFQPVKIQGDNILTYWQGRYFHHIIYLEPQILFSILKNLDQSHIRYFDRFIRYNVKYMTTHHYWKPNDVSAALSDILALFINTPAINSIVPNLENADIFTAPTICTLIHSLNFHQKLTNEEFKRKKLHEALESYIHGVVYESDPDYAINNEDFPLHDLPSDLIAVIASFLPYQRLLPFALTCKRNYNVVMTNHVVCQRKFQQMFPYDSQPKELVTQSLFSRYKNKFAMGKQEQIIMTGELIYISAQNTNVHQNIISICNYDRIKIYDFDTNQTVDFTSKKQKMYGPSRRLGDNLYAAGDVGFEICSLYNYKSVGMLETPGITVGQFDVNERWIISDRHLFDTTTGKVIAYVQDNFTSEKILLRGNMALKCGALQKANCEVLDLRTNLEPQLVRAEFRTNPRNINLSDNYLYISDMNVEIRDLRKLTEPVWISPSSMRLSWHYARESLFFMDLVSMNLWSISGQIWDLANLKWNVSENPILPLHAPPEAVWCNGKHVIYKHFDGNLAKADLAGSSYFPLSQ